MSLLERDLPEPSFVERDPNAIVQGMVAWFEEATGRTLYPAQLERLLVNVLAYRETLLREAVQDAAKLNMVRYSRAPYLDLLAENFGLSRLGAQPASVLVHVQVDAGVTGLVPQGTVLYGTGGLRFATLEDVVLSAGAEDGFVLAQCETAGVAGNGVAALSMREFDFPAFADTQGLSKWQVRLENLSESSGGSEAESDAQLRERLVLAPNQYTTAGSRGSYIFHARSASAAISDVAVWSPTPGVVQIHPLCADGLPSPAVKDAVASACNAERVRPLCDTVRVLDPQVVAFAINAKLIIYSGQQPDLIQARAEQALTAYLAQLQAGLGRDVVRLDIQQALKVAGVWDVQLIEPPENLPIAAHQWPQCSTSSVSVSNTVVQP